MKRRLLFISATLAFATQNVMATEITFENLGLPNYGMISANLATNASAPGDGFNIGSGWTPDVAVSMSSVDSAGTLVSPNLLFWGTGYGNLPQVAFASANGLYSRVSLSATPGNLVTINSFTLAGYPQSDLVADRIRIFDGNGVDLWTAPSLTVGGTGPASSTYSPTISAQNLTLEFGSNWNIGLGKLDFNQSVDPVPEPASLAAVTVGTLALLRRKRKSTK